MNKNWIVERLREPSTYKGLSLLLGAVGFAADPAMLTEIGLGVTAVIALIDIVRKERAAS